MKPLLSLFQFLLPSVNRAQDIQSILRADISFGAGTSDSESRNGPSVTNFGFVAIPGGPSASASAESSYLRCTAYAEAATHAPTGYGYHSGGIVNCGAFDTLVLVGRPIGTPAILRIKATASGSIACSAPPLGLPSIIDATVFVRSFAGVRVVADEFRTTEDVSRSLQVDFPCVFGEPFTLNFGLHVIAQTDISFETQVEGTCLVTADLILSTPFEILDSNGQPFDSCRGVKAASGTQYLVPSPCVQLRALEVTQSVQDWKNSVPLIEGKKTYVRAFLETTDAGKVGRRCSAKLRAYGPDGTTELPGSPLSPSSASWNAGNFPAYLLQSSAMDSTALRSDLSKSLNFEIDPAVLPNWSHGTVAFKLVVDADGLSEPGGEPENATVRVAFKPVPAIRLKVTPVTIKTSSGTQVPAPPAHETLAAVSRAKTMWPFANLQVEYVPEPLQLEWRRTDELRGEELLLDAACNTLDGETPGTRGMLVVDKSVFDFPGIRVNRVGKNRAEENCSWAIVGPGTYEQTVAHELAHALGQHHTVHGALFPLSQDNCKTGPCNVVDESCTADDFPFFYKHPSLPGGDNLRAFISSADTDPLGKVIPDSMATRVWGMDPMGPVRDRRPEQSQVIDPFKIFEVMGYCDSLDLLNPRGRQWPSVYTYQKMLSFLEGLPTVEGGLSPAAVAQARPRPLAARELGYLVVRAIVNLSSQQVTWLPTLCRENAALFIPTPGDHHLLALDATGSVIQDVPLLLQVPSDGGQDDPPTAVLSVSIPMNPSIRRFELRRAGMLAGALDATLQAPTVRLLAPNGGESLDMGTCEIQWIASDADGDGLTYTVQYSTDGGLRWRTLGSDLVATSLTVRCDDLRGSTNALVRVLASDGFYCVNDVSDAPFTIPDKGPRVFLLNLEMNQVFYADRPDTLECLVLDREEGELSGTNLVWRSDRDGILGTGTALTVPRGLSAGAHLFTLTATDSKGHSTTVSNLVTVYPFGPPMLQLRALNTNQTVTLALIGTPPSRAVIESSSNLVDWVVWRMVPLTSVFQLLTEPITTNETARFFRARLEGLPPTIVTQPNDANLSSGASLTFAVAAISSELMDYYWRFNGGALGNAPNSPTLTISNLQPQQSGFYSVLVSNRLGAVESRQAMVTIVGIPPSILQEPADASLVAGSTLILVVQAQSMRPMDFWWQFNGAPLAGVPNNSVLIISNAQPAMSGLYSVIVSNALGMVQSRQASVVISNAMTDPGIVQQPQDAMIPVGEMLTLSVGAQSSQPLDYYWRTNGVGGGPTAPTLMLNNALSTQSGYYSVIVSNGLGMVQSREAVINVTNAELYVISWPTDQCYVEGGSATFATQIGGDVGYTWFANGFRIRFFGESAYTIESMSSVDLQTEYRVRVDGPTGKLVSPPVRVRICP